MCVCSAAAQRPESGSPELAGPVALVAGTILGLSAEAVSQTSPVPAWPGSRVAGRWGECSLIPHALWGMCQHPYFTEEESNVLSSVTCSPIPGLESGPESPQEH